MPVFSELLLFLISCQPLPLDELDKKAEGMEVWFTEVNLLRQRRGHRKVENGSEEQWRLISTIVHVDLSSSRLSHEMIMWPLVAQTHILLKLQWEDKFSLPVALAKALEVLSPWSPPLDPLHELVVDCTHWPGLGHVTSYPGSWVWG